MVLFLKDDAERLEQFVATIRASDPELPICSRRDDQTMVREFGAQLQFAKLMSLDHDIEPESGAPNPGDGLVVARFVASIPDVRPVMFHSSNAERACWTAGKFKLAG
jgi:hypothetical protein